MSPIIKTLQKNMNIEQEHRVIIRITTMLMASTAMEMQLLEI